MTETEKLAEEQAAERARRANGGNCEATDSRPRVDQADEDGQRLLAETVEAIRKRNRHADGPVLFTTGNALTLIARLDDGRAQLEPVTSRGALFAIAVESARFVTRDRRFKNARERSALPLTSVLDAVIARARDFPPCLRVVHAPVFASDGSLHSAPGYSPAAKVWHQPLPGFTLPPVPERPTSADITGAAMTLWTPFQDFPFETDADRVHMIATVLGPFIRELIDGPTPLMLIEKTDAGAGAGLLVDVAAFVALGTPAPLTPIPKGTEEWAKVITAKLVKGAPMITLDNLPLDKVLSSDDLAVALTGSRWDVRLLGSNRMPELPIRTTWIATANNPTLSRELLRRSVRIRLVPRVERPWLRDPATFAIPDLRDWVSTHRADLVHAVLVLVRAWLAAGQPMWAGITLGTFEKWSRVVGGIFEVAGLGGCFLGNVARLYEEAETDEDTIWARVMDRWWLARGEEPSAAADLIHLDDRGRVTDFGIVNAEAAQSLGLHGDEVLRSLGNLLRARRGRMFGTKTLHRSTKKGRRGILWCLRDTTLASGRNLA